jgi:hypothetical protein
LKRAKIGGGFAIQGHGVIEFEREARDLDRQLDRHWRASRKLIDVRSPAASVVVARPVSVRSEFAHRRQ